jgi:hypothetical protein
MRYQFNFEAEPFAAYPELENQNASQLRMDSAFDEEFSASPGQTDAGPGVAPGGYRLRLPHAGVHSILSRLQPDQLRGLAGGDLPADPAAAVVRGVARIARRARWGWRFRPRSGGPALEVFQAPGYKLLVRPTGPAEGEILLVRPDVAEAEVEGETERSLAGTMTWWGPFTFAKAGQKGVLVSDNPARKLPNLKQPGIYFFEKLRNGDWTPVYVGKADNFLIRLGTRREYLHQLDVDVAPYRLYLGVGPAGTPLHGLEHAVVRSVLRTWHKKGADADPTKKGAEIPSAPLTNFTPKLSFKVASGGLSLTHKSAPGHAKSKYLRSASGAPGQWYEVPE